MAASETPSKRESQTLELRDLTRRTAREHNASTTRKIDE